tara:strand:- start:1007 stop:1156 length:150 start_codon:yes stop_codon:yes gene_type:complete
MDSLEVEVEEVNSPDMVGEIWDSPLKQSTYMFIWAIASLASFAIFFKYF